MRCSLMPFSRRIAVTSRWLESSSPTAPSISSSVPSRILASGVFSSCDMWRRKRLRSCASSSSRWRSHSSWWPRRSRSSGPVTAMRVGEVAAAELADGAIDLPQRPAERSANSSTTISDQRQQQGRLQEQSRCACSGARAAGRAISASICWLLCCRDAIGQLPEHARTTARSSIDCGCAGGGRGLQRQGLDHGLRVSQALQLAERLGASRSRAA